MARMEQVTAGIYRLGRKRHNFYLLIDGQRATVVDTGGSSELSLLRSALASCGLTLDSVEAILLTHAHTDHIGFASLAAKQGISVKTHEDEAAYAMDGSAGSQVGTMDLPMWKPRAILFVAEMIRAGAHRAHRLTSVETVTDGERLDLPGRPLVVATPGHTAGHASYLIEERKTLFSGDALVTDGLVSGKTGPPQLLPEKFHQDATKARKSLESLARLDAELLLPGHGRPWRGPISAAVSLASS